MWSQTGYCNHLPHPGHPFYHAPCSHNQRTTTFRHPVTGQVSPENSDFFLQEQPPSLRMTARPPAAGGGDGEVGVGMEQQLLRPSSAAISETSTSVTSSTVDTTSTTKVSRSAGRVHSFGKRDQAIKRNPNVPVVVRGWLYKQDSSGMRLWKRKWFVLADYCLFYYKDSREESVLGSIPLPSYVVSPVGPEDHISRKYAFKASHTGMRSYIFKQSSVIGTQAEHSGMRTYYFSADTQEDMNGWLRAMNQAALMHNHTDTLIRPPETSESTADALDPGQALPQQTNHVNHRVNAETPDPETAQPVVHEVLLEPIHHPDAEEHPSLQKDTPTTTASSVTELPMMGSPAAETDPRASLPADTSASGHHVRQMDPEPSAPSSAAGSRAPSRAPSRAASTLPPAAACTRNGLVSTPSPILEPNGIGAGTYLRTPPGATLPPADSHHQQHRRSTLEEVQQWVQVQRAEHKGPPSRESTLPRRTPPTQPKFSTKEAYQTLPKTSRPSPPPAARLGEYKYAQDRLSHFRLTPEQQAGPGGPTTGAAVWQLYEWQQRHQFRHGSPTAPLYTPAPDYPFGTRPPSAVPPSSSRSGTEGGGPHPPRCVSVPPSAADIPPPGPPSRGISPMRRPHTPADRVTVMPMGERSVVEVPFAASPRRTKSQLLKAATIERRSMPPTGYITHTVSAPSLHGKTADDTYVQLKKDLEYLDLKVFGSQTVKDSGKPVKVAESDVDVKLSQLCEQDKTLQELEANISSLKEDKDKLESVLDVSHQQMEQYQDQPAHSQKIAYQQRLLQEDLVAIRAQISRVSTEMSRAWEEYSALESSVEQLRRALQAQMNNSTASQQEKAQIKRELWRIEDVMGGLSASKANYKITISSVHNPERKLVPSVSDSAVPSQSAKLQPPHRSSQTLPHSTVPKWAEESAPPRPPLPRLYDYEDTPPVIPPLPKEASVIRHTSVRGLKRQSDERKRDRETGQGVVNGDCKVELRSYLSEPELPGLGRSNTGSEMNYQTLPSKGLSGSSSRLNQPSTVSSYVTLRRGVPGGSITRERPRSALERLSSPADSPPLPGGALAPGGQQRGRMTAEEQLERMKRHQRALVRERKRNLSQGERSSCAGLSVVSQRSSSSRLPAGASDPAPSVFDGPWREGGAYQLEERLGAEGQSDEGRGQVKDRQRIPSDQQWVTATATPLREVDVEPDEYDLDFSLELGRPRKVPIPERYVESDPEEPLSQEELDERSRKAQRMRSLLAKSSAQNYQMSSGQWVPVDFSELDSVVQQQERIMTVSHALASEASRKSKLVAAKAASER